MTHQLAIIGGGPGGYVAAQRAASQGLKVVLFEKNALGGVCLNEGCIPTKTLLCSSKYYTHSLEADKYGVHNEATSFDYGAIAKRKDKVVKKLVGAIKVSMRNLGVEVVTAQAKILGPHSVEAGGVEYQAENLLLCTGSSAVVPPFPGLNENVLTNREILSLKEQPQSLVIIGGGVIGMEFAALYNALGSKVVVVEMMPKILGPIDKEISSMLQDIYSKRGVEFHLGCKVTAIEGNDVIYEDAEGSQQRATGEKILMSVGRRANLEGLEALGLKYTLSRSGKPCGIKVDEHMQTSVRGIYAAGDVTGFSMLAHTASREGEVAVNHILGKEDRMSYDAIPGVVYTNPEVASVGRDAREGDTVLKLPMAYSGRFVAENERGEGLCKIVAESTSGRIVGVSMIGSPCSEIISTACVAIEKGMTLEEFQKVVFPHPSVSEILKETSFQ